MAWHRIGIGVILIVCSATTAAANDSSFHAFESGQVRPLAISPNGKFLFAVNTPDNRLEVFRVGPSGLSHRASITVGMEPVAVAVRSSNEVWVVNHLSDSVSVVHLNAWGQGRVTRTLLVGDEPRDIVFAGPQRQRAFITTAHRGQNSPIDPQFSQPGVGRADVWVFDADQTRLGGTPLTILTLFADTPRALATSPDGNLVYAAGFHSGNRTTTAFFPANLPPPFTNYAGVPVPPGARSLIVRFDGTHWVDEDGNIFDDTVGLRLPDKDVFIIDAAAEIPQQLSGDAGYVTDVGTVLYNMAVNPVSGHVYVSNTEAVNHQRFEGPGTFFGRSTRGHLHESHITVLQQDGTVLRRHLNKHIDYGQCCAPIPNQENQHSLALPQGMAISADGSTLYVAALGSDKVGVFATEELESDTFIPSDADHITIPGGGPTGLLLDEAHNRLYVLARFDNAVSVIDLASRTEIAHHFMHNPEPASITEGRRFLYDASFSSSHGDSSCASCHVFADFDSLAWDLGNPDGDVLTNPGPFISPPEQASELDFHPLKGPMVTQSLRGMANHGPMHWRGDRTGGNDEASAQPDGGAFDENAAFLKFRVAFTDLLGRDSTIPEADLQAFADFILQVMYPPNPVRALDNSLTPSEQSGRDIYFGPNTFLGENCVGCHPLDPGANPAAQFPGFFGTDGRGSFNGGQQMFKSPHLRNMYQKVGMFGMADNFLVNLVFPFTDRSPPQDQVRGFGFFHDGSVDTLFRFLSHFFFFESPDNPLGFPLSDENITIREDLEAFMLAFDSNLAPIVGQQITLPPTGNADTTADINAAINARIDLLKERATHGECDLVLKSAGRFSREVGFLYLGDDQGESQYRTDVAAIPDLPETAIRGLAQLFRRPITFTCVPPGAGHRIALDRDMDGALDGDERIRGTDPADPWSHP